MLRDVPVPDAAPTVVDHDEHGARAEGEGLHRAPVSSPDAGRVVAQKRAPRLTRGAPQRLPAVATHGAGADLEAKGTQLADDADGAPPRMLSGDADDQLSQLCGNPGSSGAANDSSSASRRAKQNDASAPPCPARPSRACLASRTNRVPVVTSIGGRGNGAAVDDGPLCRRRADAAAPSARGRDLGGRGPMRRVLRQADGGRAQTSLSWLADTLLSQDRPAPIRFCRPTGWSATCTRTRSRACGSLFKRSIMGSFHKVSAKHLDRYLAELEWRFNNRKNSRIFMGALRRISCGRTRSRTPSWLPESVFGVHRVETRRLGSRNRCKSTRGAARTIRSPIDTATMPRTARTRRTRVVVSACWSKPSFVESKAIAMLNRQHAEPEPQCVPDVAVASLVPRRRWL